MICTEQGSCKLFSREFGGKESGDAEGCAVENHGAISFHDDVTGRAGERFALTSGSYLVVNSIHNPLQAYRTIYSANTHAARSDE